MTRHDEWIAVFSHDLADGPGAAGDPQTAAN
jgi:hypothetical protein